MDKVKTIKTVPPKDIFDQDLTFWQKCKYKLLSLHFLKKVLWSVFRFVLLFGIAYVVIFPYISKISGSFMSREDFVDVSVKLIPKYPTLDTYKAIINDNKYVEALLNTTTISVLCGVIQMMICAIVGYGFAKFNFKGKGILFLAVIFTMVIPHETIRLSLFMQFRYFDIFGIIEGLKTLFGAADTSAPSLLNSNWPMIIMSATGLAFKNSLFIFLMRQYYKGVPDELEEAAYVDGAGVLKTFVNIILPMSVPMLVTIFMFAFSWQWSDTFYTGLFFPNAAQRIMLPDIVAIPSSLDTAYAAQSTYEVAIRNTCGLLILLPLVVVYLFAQRTLIEGVERSGITG